MTKSIAAPMRAHLAQEVTTLTTCVQVTWADGTTFGFTDHDQDVLLGGLTYYASSGYSASQVQTRSDLSVDNLELAAFLDSPLIKTEDISAGKWDYAAVSMFRVNWANPTQTMHLRSGTLGEVTLKRGQFVAELRGLLQSLARPILEVYSPGCRARLGDERCKVDLTEYTATGVIETVSSKRAFTSNFATSPPTVRLTPTSTGAPPDNYFRGGLLTWTSGENAGLNIEVKSYVAASGAFQLHLTMPNALNVGDAFSAQTGCDKLFSTCISKFGNAVNFRGEPHVPGIDAIFQVGTH